MFINVWNLVVVHNHGLQHAFAMPQIDAYTVLLPLCHLCMYMSSLLSVPISVRACVQVISVSVSERALVLGGADIVDGSPVLDIKPYVPFCDSVPHARAPAYVKVGGAHGHVSHAQQSTPFLVQGMQKIYNLGQCSAGCEMVHCLGIALLGAERAQFFGQCTVAECSAGCTGCRACGRVSGTTCCRFAMIA
jgi:hypothetical protein